MVAVARVTGNRQLSIEMNGIVWDQMSLVISNMKFNRKFGVLELHLHAREAFQRWPPSDMTCLKGPLKCFETCCVVLCVDVISNETGIQGGKCQAVPPFFFFK